MDEKEKRIKELYEQGMILKDIASVLGISLTKVKNTARKLRLSGAVKGRADTSAVNEEELKNLYYSGLSYIDMAKQIGKHPNTVEYICKKMREEGKLEPRKRAKRTRISIEVKRKTSHEQYRNAVPSGKPVKCTQAVSRKCIYGNSTVEHLCNFATITGRCRTALNGVSGLDPPDACCCYVERKGHGH